MPETLRASPPSAGALTLTCVPDALFNDPRLAQIYDLVEGERDDLDHYLAIAAEFGADSVLDVGCGTGIFACLLAERGLEVVGVDPAAALLDIARTRPGSEMVTWVLGDASRLPAMLSVDLATMTGNVCHVFLTDDALSATLRGVHAALRPGGHFVFELRNPLVQPWLNWNRENTYTTLDAPGVGRVETWWDLTEINGAHVSYRRTYVFASDGTTLTSDSTRRFWSRAEIEDSLRSTGYTLMEVRDAPDRPGREWVFITQKAARG